MNTLYESLAVGENDKRVILGDDGKWSTLNLRISKSFYQLQGKTGKGCLSYVLVLLLDFDGASRVAYSAHPDMFNLLRTKSVSQLS
jgi:hypothetical protein